MFSQKKYLFRFILFGGLLVLCAAGFICLRFQQDQDSTKPTDDEGVEITDSFKGRDVWVWATPVRASEFRINFSLPKAENIRSDRPVPYTVEVKADEARPIGPKMVLFHGHCDNDRGWYCQYNTRWRIGIRGGAPDPDAIYRLPFEKGKHFKVTQTSFGGAHSKEDGTDYAVDFAMPLGTPVCAARDGLVVGYREDSNCGGKKIPEYKNHGNYLILKQEDGTYAEYHHLLKDGVLVELGDRVKVGQKIALSGNTGYSSGPHLHFNVYYVDDKFQSWSVPVAFSTDSGIKNHLRMDTLYGH